MDEATCKDSEEKAIGISTVMFSLQSSSRMFSRSPEGPDANRVRLDGPDSASSPEISVRVVLVSLPPGLFRGLFLEGNGAPSVVAVSFLGADVRLFAESAASSTLA